MDYLGRLNKLTKNGRLVAIRIGLDGSTTYTVQWAWGRKVEVLVKGGDKWTKRS